MVDMYDLVDLEKGDKVYVNGREYAVEKIEPVGKKSRLLDVIVHTQDGRTFAASGRPNERITGYHKATQ